MKKILVAIAMMLVGFSMQAQQAPNKLRIYQNTGNILEYALDDIDSLTHSTSLPAYLYIYLQNQPMVTVPQNSIDSIAYTYVPPLICGFGGYRGVYRTMTDVRDGQVYKVVTIGNQTWMAENLRYDVPGVNSLDTVNSNNPCLNYGRIYDWYTIMNGASSSSAAPSGVQGICPNGWHIPSDEEWKEFERFSGMSPVDIDAISWRGTDQGMLMKSRSNWFNNGNGTNVYGFNALPAGYYNAGSFYNLNSYGFFWTSTEDPSTKAWLRYVNNGSLQVNRNSYNKTTGASCRCIEDVPCQSTYATDTIVTCGSHTWIDGVTYTSSNNTATHVVTNAQGCDSIITLDLTIFVGTPVINGHITDCRDGQVYEVVTIGNQTWMAENLRYDVPGVNTYWNSPMDHATDTVNPNNPAAIYGRLYDWNTVMAGSNSSAANPSGVQGICPSGWHVPSEDEWQELERFMGMTPRDLIDQGARGTDQGGKMKSLSGWTNNGNGNNSTGLNAFPAGSFDRGNFYGVGDNAYFWSSTLSFGSNAWLRDLYHGHPRVVRNNRIAYAGFSCRCIQD